MGRSGSVFVQGRDPLASCPGVPHTAPRGATVHDAFPSFPPNKIIIILLMGSLLPSMVMYSCFRLAFFGDVRAINEIATNSAMHGVRRSKSALLALLMYCDHCECDASSDGDGDGEGENVSPFILRTNWVQTPFYYIGPSVSLGRWISKPFNQTILFGSKKS